MAKRLVKIANELNVGTSTIVDFLNKNGFNVNPTTKVTPSMEQALEKEFQTSKSIKEKADKLNIRFNSPQKEKPTVDVPPVAPPPPPPVAPPVAPPVPTPPPAPKSQPKEIVPPPPVTPPKPPVVEEKVKTPPAPPAPKKKEIEVVQENKDEEKTGGLKIVGKIDLDNISNKRKSNKRTSSGKDKKKTSSQNKNRDNSKSKRSNTPPKDREREEKDVHKRRDDRRRDNERKPKENPKPPAVKEEKAPKENVQVPKESPVKDDKFRAKTPQLEGLKIKGKINLDRFAPKRKKKEDPKKAGDNSKKPKGSTGAGGEKKKEGGEDPSKKRRRRTKKVVVKKTIEGNKRTNSGVTRNRKNTSKGKSKKDEPQEVSSKEIEERIKATQARLSGGGRKKRQNIRRESRAKKREEREKQELEKKDERLQLTEFVSVSEIANLMDVSPTAVITTCMNLGYFVTLNQRLDAEVIEIVASEFGHEVVFVDAEESLEEEEEIVDAPEDLKPRAPIVTVMGHVDHGKTSLLDYVRNASVASGEAGGITQHIGAYEVYVGEGDERKKVTFLDTPGHEAFTAMRARGAKVTDVAIIIISADDRVMPQTKEAISHAQAAEVPMVFAINKIDKAGADPERIKAELAQMGFQVEDWGGSFQSQDISAKHGTNIDELLEKILLEAEILELSANPNRAAQGVILEASLDKGKGYVTKALIQTGTLRIGDPMVSGEHSGKVKAMFNEHGKRIKEAGPSTPVMVLGLSGAPQAGEKFKVTESEQEARAIAQKRSILAREQANRARKHISLKEIGRRLALGSFKELNLIVKGDVDGSVEALADALLKQSQETVQINVLHKAVGQIIESDVMLAAASDAIIVGFQVRPSAGARRLAEKEGVEVKQYSVIYQAIDEIRAAIEGMLEPTEEERTVCEVEVRETFKINRVGTIAGCFVSDGKITRNTLVRVIRDGIVVYPLKEKQVGELGSLKRYKDDVREVPKNMECGLTIKNFNDIKVGDIIEGYEVVEVKQKLEKMK